MELHLHPRNKLLFFILLLAFPLNVLALGCHSQDVSGCRDARTALKLKLGSIAIILVAGAIGVSLPILGRTIHAVQPESDAFFVIKAFAAGIILGVACIHILPNAYHSLGSACLNGKFNLAGFILMIAMVATLMIDTFATSYYKRLELAKAKPVGEEDLENTDGGANETSAHTHAGHGHAHRPAAQLLDQTSQLTRHRVLELGILVHSLIIGISLGTCKSPCIIKPLMVALSFHQFFEGLGLSGCIVQAKFRNAATVTMAIFFSLTTPLGVAVGAGISSVYDENSTTALIVEGVLNSAAAGILVYMALVDILAADLMHPKMQSCMKLQIKANFFLLLGVSLMSILAKWA
ncbi:Zinc transporter 5 [Nymphaea thermarum]|nr:Zinc transporter 5 [Nymphaea thermarum]